jgi:nucleoside-diphosphate-sugar epimerase
MRFTVLGGGGYIGSRLAAALRAAGHEVLAPPRGAPPAPGAGHVVYAVGVASDFRTRPLDTIRAHVGLLEEHLRAGGWESFLYLYSTRVYAGAASGREGAALVLRPADPDQLYNASKVAGEALCLTLPHPGVRVVRLANVYGDDAGTGTFIADVLAAATGAGAVEFRTHPDSAKDYVALEDVLALLPRIALGGRERLYNVAAGRNVRVGELAAELRGLGVRCAFAGDPAPVVFPPIDIGRVRTEFGFVPLHLLERLPALVAPAPEATVR